MTKPDDVLLTESIKIPSDILEAAMQALKAARPRYESVDQYEAHWVAVARSIEAEREACAQVADTLVDVLTDEIADASTNMSRQILSTQRHAIQTAAAAIRRRSEASAL